MNQGEFKAAVEAAADRVMGALGEEIDGAVALVALELCAREMQYQVHAAMAGQPAAVREIWEAELADHFARLKPKTGSVPS